MAEGQAGMIAHERGTDGRFVRAAPPSVRVVTFRYDGASNYLYNILPADGAPSEEVVQRERIARALGEPWLRFSERPDAASKKRVATFASGDPDVVHFVRGLIIAGALAAREDLGSMPLRCDQCDFTTSTATEADRRALYLHRLSVHPEAI